MTCGIRFCIGLSDLFRDFRVVGVWIGFFPGFLLVSCMDAVTFTAVKTRRTMTIFLIVVIVPLLVAVFVGIAKVRQLSSTAVVPVPVPVPATALCIQPYCNT